MNMTGYELALYLGNLNRESGDASIRLALTISVLYTILFFLVDRSQKYNRDARSYIARATAPWSLAFVLLFLVLFLIKDGATYSRLGVACCYLVGLFLMPLVHHGIEFMSRSLLQQGHVTFQQIALIGLTDEAELAKTAASLSKLGIAVTQCLHIAASGPARGRYLADCRQAALDIQTLFRHAPLDAIWIVAPIQDQRRLEELRAALSHLPLPIVFFPDAATQRMLQQPPVKIGDFTGFEVQRAPLQRWERQAKRAMDIVIALIALALLWPVMLFASLAVLAESGRPILFRQDRNGFGGRPFVIFKFRSMRTQENGSVVKQAEPDDQRTTAIGRLLRRTSIDELPQLFNVLRGQMSIVGPRPHAIAHDTFYDRIVAGYAFRHHVKPGITGWAQVNGYRGNTTEISRMEKRVELDLWYINHWSLWLDLKIAVKTVPSVLMQRQAY